VPIILETLQMEVELIEDVIAQAHMVVDSLTFQEGTIALSALRTIGDSSSHPGPFSQLLGVKFHNMADGQCTASLEVKEHLLNPLGIAHGGVTFSLADTACGGAALSALGAPRMVTQDLQIRYHGPVRPGELTAEAEVVHLGTRTITTQCRVTQLEILVATVTATFAILNDDELKLVKGGE
jgi:uncharacterized protein (TIGR00369 family)